MQLTSDVVVKDALLVGERLTGGHQVGLLCVCHVSQDVLQEQRSEVCHDERVIRLSFQVVEYGLLPRNPPWCHKAIRSTDTTSLQFFKSVPVNISQFKPFNNYLNM